MSKVVEQSVPRRLAAIQREDTAAAHHSPKHAVDLLARIRAYLAQSGISSNKINPESGLLIRRSRVRPPTR
jgi:hypothetical protein